MLGSNEVIRTDFFSPEECNQVKEYIDSKNFNTTKYFDRYNFFYDNPQYVDKFVLKLKDILHLDFPIAVQAWVNSYEKGQGIEPHNHLRIVTGKHIEDYHRKNNICQNISLC